MLRIAKIAYRYFARRLAVVASGKGRAQQERCNEGTRALQLSKRHRALQHRSRKSGGSASHKMPMPIVTATMTPPMAMNSRRATALDSSSVRCEVRNCHVL